MARQGTRDKGQGTRDKPSSGQLAFKSDSVRCFYCKALLLLTDEKAGHAVCSNNCPSRLVQLDAYGMSLVRRAWLFKTKLESQTEEVVTK